MPRKLLAAAVIGTVLLLSSNATAQNSKASLVGGPVASPTAADAFPMISPDGRYLYFSRQKSNRGWSHQTVVFSEASGDGWSEPQTASFSGGNFSDRAPRLSPDGTRLYFSSDRPRPDSLENADYNIWMVESTGRGQWGPAQLVDGWVSSPAADMHTSMSSDGTLYVASSRSGSRGRSDLYRFRPIGDSRFTHGENLGDPFNSELSQPDLYVSPAGDMIIFAVTNHPQGFGGDDLWVSFMDNGQWTEPENLGPDVNESDYEYGPSISPDGVFLYFTSHRSGGGDIYRIRVRDVPALNR
jgi:Tol biopolymer transport system component